jgi:hypothetical protein
MKVKCSWKACWKGGGGGTGCKLEKEVVCNFKQKSTKVSKLKQNIKIKSNQINEIKIKINKLTK